MQVQVDLDAVTLQAKAAWQADARLREEFVGNEAAYLAGCRAEARGAVRVLRGTVLKYGTAEAEAAQRFYTDAVLHFGAGSKIELSGPARGRFRGYASVFGGAPNRKGMRILPGAFKDAVQRTPLPLLWAHDHDRPIGQVSALLEDSHGLLTEGQINLSVSAGAQAFELLSAGDITGLSIGFRSLPGGSKEANGVLEFSRVDLMEISIAPVPAEARARVFEVRGA